jgi:hypothetical protein
LDNTGTPGVDLIFNCNKEKDNVHTSIHIHTNISVEIREGEYREKEMYKANYMKLP